jgi:CheY-like chemotaxis protein
MPVGGTLTIETANARLDPAYATTHLYVTPGEHVMIAVSDTGTGMSPDVVAKVFDPFFTTKPVGEGSGLGLSMVYGFVKQSAGYINVYSEVGDGTSIKIYLPRQVGTAAERVVPTAIPTVVGGSGERILLVDDDDEVREYAAVALSGLGYRVTEARDGASALEVLRSPEQVDLLFTDVGLPGQNGRRLAEQARQVRPGLRVLYTTGYTRNAIVHQGILDADVLLLSKPYTLDALAEKVREALGFGAAPAC